LRKPLELSEQDKLVLKATKILTAPSRDDKKRKRLPGEDDTDRDLRFAKEQQEKRSENAVARLRATRDDEAEAPMVDDKGHINLFPERKPKNSERGRKSELEKERKQQRDADEGYGMQLKDAWGHKDPKGAWYMDKDGTVKDSLGKDVWGNEDPRRRERQARRVVSSDPLAFMKQAQVQIKEGRREREDREREMRLSKTREEKELDDFSLDAKPSRSNHDRHQQDGNRQRHRRRRRSRDRSRSRERRKKGPNER